MEIVNIFLPQPKYKQSRFPLYTFLTSLKIVSSTKDNEDFKFTTTID